MSFNKIIIVGYLGRDPELRYTPQGTAVCNLSVATTEKRRNAGGETEEHTIWFRVSAWGRQAEVAAEYLAKGRQVYVEGRLRLEEYTDREGNPRTSAEVNASDIHFLGQRGDATNGAVERADETNRRALDSGGSCSRLLRLWPETRIPSAEGGYMTPRNLTLSV